MGKIVNELIKRFGTILEFRNSLQKGIADGIITELEAINALKDYEVELENAKQLDLKVITIEELRKRKAKKERDKIMKKLLDHADKLPW